MLLNLSDLSSESLQSQIISQIRAKILAGELETGFMLPSIRSLARKQKVSVITIQRAYEALLREGLIHARRGKGFFISPIGDSAKKEMAVERLVENIAAPIETALAEGLHLEEVKGAIDSYLQEKEKDFE
jgi:GntR family transcriptional regulator